MNRLPETRAAPEWAWNLIDEILDRAFQEAKNFDPELSREIDKARTAMVDYE